MKTKYRVQLGIWPKGFISIQELHWRYIAYVVFEEDSSLANTGHAAENMGLLRRTTMNIIKTIDPARGLADARRNAI